MKLEELLHLKEVKDYLEDRERLAYVSKGGKGNASCSFMDIASRTEYERASKKKAELVIGKIILQVVLDT